jgi:hypothetical protein
MGNNLTTLKYDIFLLLHLSLKGVLGRISLTSSGKNYAIFKIAGTIFSSRDLTGFFFRQGLFIIDLLTALITALTDARASVVSIPAP